MKTRRTGIRFFTCSLVFVLLCPNWGSFATDNNAQTSSLGPKSYQFINGQWFDGKTFRRQILYSVDGVLVRKKPERIDEIVDLKNGYVIPPFADAHTHHFDNPANIEQHVAMYLTDGVFYAKVPTNVRTRALLVANKVNRPNSVDVSYAHGGLTSSFGHPMATYEGLALYHRPAPFDAEETERVRASRLRDNDAYYIIDTARDLEKKWPLILDGKPDFIKVYLFDSNEYEERRRWADRVGHTGLDPKLVPLIVNKAHAAGLRVSTHVNSVFDYRVALKAGVDEMAHLPGNLVDLNADSQKYKLSEDDAKETARHGVWVVPAPAFLETFNSQNPAFNAQIKKQTEEVKIHNLKLLKRYGVKIAFGSDNFGRSPVKDVLYLESLKVFSKLEMLKIWCEDTPRTIFPRRKIGVLADGYEASFLVLGDNPLSDFRAIKNIRLRFKQGYFLKQPIERGTNQSLIFKGKVSSNPMCISVLA